MADRLDLEVPSHLGQERLDRVLEALVPDISRSRLQKIVRRGDAWLGGKRTTRSNVRVQKGQRLRLDLEPGDRPGVEPAAPPGSGTPTILFEDDEVIVIDKPTGLLTHPADRRRGDSAAMWLAREHGPLALPAGNDRTAAERPGVVHRLDRETSGVMVFARSDRALEHLRDQFRAREVRKEYLALVHGDPHDDGGRCELPLEPSPDQLDRQRVAAAGEGKEACTDWEVIERYGIASFVRCKPRTGRRHQIRVHLRELGLPIVADALYAHLERFPRLAPLPADLPSPGRLALHAHKLSFAHPGTGKRATYEAPFASDLAELRNALRARA